MSITLTINGKAFSTHHDERFSYADIVRMAHLVGSPSMTLRCEDRSRIVHPGDTITAADGMIVNVYDTSNA